MRISLIAALLFSACKPATPAPDAGPVTFPRHTPRWAFEPWISKDISTAADTYDFVDGFRARDIPVGVVVLDSPWETNYNTFVPNPSRYPEFPTLVADMRSRGVRVVLWTTPMVNESSFDAEMGGDRYVGCSRCATSNELSFTIGVVHSTTRTPRLRMSATRVGNSG